MIAHPFLIGGDSAMDTDIIQRSGGRLVAKLGAEGLLCITVPDRGWGIAITIDSGSDIRGYGPFTLAVIQQFDLVDEEFARGFAERWASPVLTFRSEPVGGIRAVFSLDRTYRDRSSD
jgi:L-asparaginase II